jgi:hypothetical protein
MESGYCRSKIAIRGMIDRTGAGMELAYTRKFNGFLRPYKPHHLTCRFQKKTTSKGGIKTKHLV